MFDFLRKMWSYVTRKPVFRGYGTTTGEEKKVQRDPAVADPKNLVFYKLRTDLGAFEIRHVKRKTDDRISYVVFNSDDHMEFEISKKWFDYLFEEVVNETMIDYRK